MREGSTSGRMPVEMMIAHHQNGFSAADERCCDNSKNMQPQMAHSSTVPSRRPVTLTMSADDYRLTNREAGSVVLGVLMVDERGIGTLRKDSDFKYLNERACTPVILGSVLIEKKLSFSLVLAEELRKRILKEVPSLSGNFCFLTKNGWPISKDQERQVPIDQIVNEQYAVVLRKQFEKSRVGLVADEKEHLGFIFIELNSSLRQVRDAIGEQLKENKLLVRNEFKFIEKMGFPVTSQQENLLTVADAVTNSTLLVQTCASSLLYDPSPANTLTLPVNRISPTRRGSPVFQTLSLPPSVDESDSPRISPITLNLRDKEKKKSFFSKNDHKRGTNESSLGLVAKPILISYVRAEAAQHALTLKEELYKLGFSVYLDVHEIKSGADWQDSLNFAVSNCEVFVPLITPMYGKTQWTNREVKLADVLQKFIIPINFMDHWPPECLAIQFASTQYVAWKPLENDHMKGIDVDKYTSDYRIWDIKFVKTVSRQIATRLMAQLHMVPDYINFSQKRFLSITAAPPISPQRKTVRMSGIVEDMIEMKDRQTKLVVISAHPKQLIFASEVKKMLEDMGYQVWCSTELIEGAQETESFGGLTSAGTIMRELSTIPEGETIKPLDEPKPFVSVTRGPSQSKKPLARTDSSEAGGVVEKRTLTRLSSQMSTTSMVSESLTPDKIDRLKKFQEKVDNAGAVIVVASEAYFKSTTSRQQAFYCEHRKKIILIKYDDSSIPALFAMLMGNDMISEPQGAQFSCALKARVKRELDPASSVTPKDATMEAKMQYLVSFMKKNLPVLESCVYVSGSSRMQNERSAEICKEIGKALAKVKNINVVTGGFYGAGDITARAFEEALQNNPRSPMTPSPTSTGPIFHILPVKDTKDFTKKATQNEEGSFEPVPYGNTLFLGDSVKERESVVARLFDICLVIEGGPGSAHEVEEFIWNDHYVIPIISTGGAAGGDFGVPYKIFETPPNVCEDDWSVLASKEASPQSVARAVVNIVIALKTAIANHAIKQNQDKKEKAACKVNRKRSKKSRKLTRNMKDVKNMSQSRNSSEFPLVVKSESLEANDKLITDRDQTLHIPGNENRWQKIVKYLRPTCLPTQT